MRNKLKKSFALLLCAVMLFGSAPLDGFAGLELPDLSEIFTAKVKASSSGIDENADSGITLAVDDNSYTTKDNIHFTFSVVNNIQKHLVIYCMVDGSEVVYSKADITQDSYEKLISSPGSYFAEYSIDDENGTVKSNRVHFEVKSSYGDLTKELKKDFFDGGPDYLKYGVPMFHDELFQYGTNGADIYNNAGNGLVTLERVARDSSCPTSSDYMLKITTAGDVRPGCGGYVQWFGLTVGGEYYSFILARIPKGYFLNHASNSLGYLGTSEWLTSNAGTGEWELYVCKTEAGLVFDPVHYEDSGYFYLSGPAGTAESPVTWYVGYTNTFDRTGKMVFTDSWDNNTYYYNNYGANNPVLERYTSSEPFPDTRILKITTSGNTTPGLGGYYREVWPSQGGTYHHKILAKVPVGYRLEYHMNTLYGDIYWVTDNHGTGEWAKYEYVVDVDDDSASLGTFGFVALYPDNLETGMNYNSATSVEWYVAYSNVYQTFEEGANISNTVRSLAKFRYNGHVYAYFDYVITWHEAKLLCEKMGGHLATITSSEENAAIASYFPTSGCSAYWIGATDENHEGTWKWITDELWDYTNWSISQPDNSGGVEHYLELWDYGNSWNDNQDGTNSTTGLKGFICEYNDESPAKVIVNGNKIYALYNYTYTFNDAENFCQAIGGHLVSINSEAENNIVKELLYSGLMERYWIGCSDTASEGNWAWTDGSSFSYNNWALGEPNGGTYQNYGSIYSPYGSWTVGTWDDLEAAITTGFICEIDIDSFSPIERCVYGNNAYEFYTTCTAWDIAKIIAEQRNGHLMTITNSEENNFLKEYADDYGCYAYWLGATDAYNEGTWKWITNEPWTFSDFAQGQPDDTKGRGAGDGEDYLEFHVDFNAWNDNISNALERAFIIEYENVMGLSEDYSWDFDGNTLTLSGSGDLSDFGADDNISWFKNVENITFDGDFIVSINTFKESEWYRNLSDGPVVVNGYLLGYKGDMPENAELVFNNVQIVAADAFKNQKNLKSVTFNDTLKSISENSFANCIGLCEIVLPDGIVNIADNAFSGNNNMKISGYYNPYIENYASNNNIIYQPYTVTITLDPTKGRIDNSTITVIAKKELADAVIPVPDSDDYMFNGWYADEDLTVPITSESIFTEDSTIYAAWLEISSVEIKTMPDTLLYTVGDSIDTSGLVLKATYSNGDTEDYDTGFVCTPERFTKQGKYRVKVSFKGKTVYYYATVKEPENMTLSVVTLPQKLDYEIGEEFVPTGLNLLLDYGNGITKNIKNGFSFDYDFSTAGTKCVIVNYTVGGTTLSTGVNVEVSEPSYVVYSDDIVCSGTTFDVPVKIRGNQGIMEISLNFSYDSALIVPVSIAANEELDCRIFDTIGEKDGVFTALWSGDNALYDDDTLFTVTFEIIASKKCETEISITYNSDETCNENWMDVTLNCKPINITISVSEAPSFFADSINASAEDAIEIPVYVSNPLGLTQAIISISYDDTMFSLASIYSDCGTTSFVSSNMLQINWRGNLNEDGVLFTVKLNVNEDAVGQYVFDMSCLNAAFEDSGTIKCSGFSVNVENSDAARIYFENGYLVPGEDVNVKIMIDDNPGVMGFSLTINYDPDVLTFKTLKKCELTKSGSFDYAETDGTIKLVWNSTDDITGNGALFELGFSSSEGDYTSTDLSISYDSNDTFDSCWNEVIFNCESKTIREYEPQSYHIIWNIGDKEYKTLQCEGTDIPIPDVNIAHYNIVGWEPEIPSKMPSQDISFTALLSAKKYTATFYIDNEAVSIQEYTVETEKLIEPEIPPKPYYIARWQGYNLKTGGDLSIYAVYESPNTFMTAQKTLSTGDSFRLIYSSNYAVESRNWYSDNEEVATVDSHGNVSALKEGECYITVVNYGKDDFGNTISSKSKTKIVVHSNSTDKQSTREKLEIRFIYLLKDIIENLKSILRYLAPFIPAK